MKIFLVKLLCAFLPKKAWRKKVRLYFNIDRLSSFKKVLRSLYTKKIECLDNANQVESIFLGSSHVEYAFYPQFYSPTSFNLGTNSQDIYNSYAIYTYLENKLPNCKDILLGISVFSNG